MSWKWVVQGSRLLLTNGTEIFFPDAATVFSAINGEKHAFMILAPNLQSPKDDLPELRFSAIGVPVRMKMIFSEQQISLSCYIERRGVSIQLEGTVRDLPDNLVIDNKWFYINDTLSEIKEVLTSAKVESLGRISLAEYVALARELLKHPTVHVQDEARDMLINHPSENEGTAVSANLRANLYPYQQQGFRWLRFIAGEECGCILGDEMGLGKTLQVIALIVSRITLVNTPVLVVAPVSLLENWRREFEKFTTSVKVLVHHGSNRTGFFKDFLRYDVVVASYNTAVSDLSILSMVNWSLLVLDEAQNIKNPGAARTKSIKRIPHVAAVAITGTPFENHMSDLWSLIDFIAPGSLGTQSEFSFMFPDDVEGARKLEPILTPLMLRRRVADVAQDLPERIDIPQALELSEYEADLYEDERSNIIELYGERATLPMLQKLRMYCTHPSLADDELPSDPCINSTKYQRLCELLDEISDIGEKVILFTSYNAMFDILSKDIPKRFGMPVLAINGSTPTSERQEIIDRFSDLNGTALLVLNPKAAGTGLNITAASRVIHYNLEWNPALEDQASARAYRRGQKRRVFVYRLFYKDTVEEVINERIEKKREMFGAAIVGTDGKTENTEDIMRALMMSPKGGVR